MASLADIIGLAPNRPRQSDLAYDVLKNEIVLCRLRPGANFSEIDLSNRYNLARAATRAALIRLTQVGLVQPVPRHGFKISPITMASVRELFQLRLMIEPKAAALAAGKVDAALLRRINRQPQTAQTPAAKIAFLDSNRAFHREIAAATGNARLFQLLESLADEMTRLVHLGLFAARQISDELDADQVAADAEHEALIVALESGDAQAAECAATLHIEHARQMVLDRIVNGTPIIGLG